MAHKRGAKRTRRQLPDALDVLEGRIEIRPEDLFDLIHEVNPTRRRLAAEESARRYQLKSRLQSLLIRRFGDQHLAVVPQSGQVVSLEHVSGARDACHVPLSELEPDARAWVRKQLDLQAAPPHEPEEPWAGPPALAAAERDDSGTLNDLLRRAREAFEEYDYEAAERRLGLAFERSGGAEEAAGPLLELLVGRLGMDAEALELEPRISTAARRRPAVRIWLALAAARTGAGDRALELIQGVEDARTIDVHAALADQALRDHDLAAASRHLEAVTERDPAQPQIQRLKAGIEALRAEDRRPAEEALLHRYRSAGPMAVEEEARDLGRRWPESEVCQRILHEVAEQRRRTSIDRSLELAEQALGEERFEAAARYLRQAIEAGSDRADLAARLAETERRGREREEAERVAAVVEQLDGGEGEDSLLAYLALPEPLREKVRRQRQLPALAWLEEAAAATSGSRAQAAAAAVLALGRCVVALESGDAAAAADQLAPHLKALRGVAEASRVWEQAGGVLARARRQRARATLEDARQALAAARLEEAATRLEEIEAGELEPAERAEVKELRGRLEHQRTVALLCAEVERQVAAGDFLSARSTAHELRRGAVEEEERQRWRQRLAELERGLREAWRLEVAAVDGTLAELVDCPGPVPSERALVWLDDGGRELVLIHTWGRWLFLRQVDVARSEVTVRVSLRTPEPLGRHLSVWVQGDRVWVLGTRGGVLEITRPDWHIHAWHSLMDLLPTSAEIRSAIPIPGSRPGGPPEVWIEIESQSKVHDWTTHVVDLGSRRLGREFARSWALPVLGAAPRMVTAPLLGGARLHSAQGTPIAGGLLPLGGRLRSACAAPEGEGYLLVDLRDPRGDPLDEEIIDHFYPRQIKDGGEGVFLLWIEPVPGAKAFRLRSTHRLEHGSDQAVYAIATALESGTSYLLDDGDPVTELVAFQASGSDLAEVYRVAIPPQTGLVQDRHGRRVVAVTEGPESLEIVSLDRQPPRLSSSTTPDPELLSFEAPFLCDPHTLETDGELRPDSIHELFGGFEIEDFIDQIDEENPADMARVVAMTLIGLREADDAQLEQAEPTLKWLEKQPQFSAGAFLAACQETKLDIWESVLANLRRADPKRLNRHSRRHYWHLLGLAQLHFGRIKEALSAFKKGLKVPGRCALEPLVDLTRPMSDPPRAKDWAPHQPLVRQLLGAIRTADSALDAGDPEAARAALDRAALWRADELQSSARLARAWLGISAQDPRACFRKRLALARFLHLHQERGFPWPAIEMPGLSWGAERLARVAERAAAWLEGSGSKTLAEDSGPAPDGVG